MKFKEIKSGMVIHCPKEEDARAFLEYLHETDCRYWEDGIDITKEDEHYRYYRIIDGMHNGLSIDWATYTTPPNCEITEFSDLIEPDDSYGKWEQMIDGYGKTTGFLCECGRTSLEASQFCPDCGKNMYNDSPINSPTDSPMSAVEVLEWLSHFVSYDDYGCVFERLHDEYGNEYGFTDLVNEYTPEEIVQKITAYEAAKKVPKPIEIEFLIISRIYEWQGDKWEEVKRVEHIVDGDRENEYEIAKQDLLDYRQSPQWRHECYVESERRCRVKESEQDG